MNWTEWKKEVTLHISYPAHVMFNFMAPVYIIGLPVTFFCILLLCEGQKFLSK